jgi:hypothetical protein
MGKASNPLFFSSFVFLLLLLGYAYTLCQTREASRKFFVGIL